jgi:hypothetical protein
MAVAAVIPRGEYCVVVRFQALVQVLLQGRLLEQQKICLAGESAQILPPARLTGFLDIPVQEAYGAAVERS